MKVSKGFSEELQSCKWAKAEVELDEEDLLSLLLEHGQSVEDLTVSQKYGILSAETERLAVVEYIMALKVRGLEAMFDMDMLAARVAALKHLVDQRIKALSD
jgi:hypothetical protein